MTDKQKAQKVLDLREAGEWTISGSYLEDLYDFVASYEQTANSKLKMVFERILGA